MSLVPVDTSSALAVSDYLDNARQWLATAVEMTGPAEIAMVRAEIATAAEATKQLHLSKEIQQDAIEMVRRAEYALGKSIRKGQSEGSIGIQHFKHGDIGNADITTPHEAAGLRRASDLTDAYSLSDEVSPDEFEVALEAAKSEGNLSRANVVRKIKGQQGPTTREERALLIEDLALQGYTSRQMTERVGVTEETVRQIARDFGVEIPGDRTSLRTRRINPAQAVENTATALEGLAMGVELIAAEEIDPALASQWADSLRDSMKALNAFTATIRKRAR